MIQFYTRYPLLNKYIEYTRFQPLALQPKYVRERVSKLKSSDDLLITTNCLYNLIYAIVFIYTTKKADQIFQII